MIVDHICVNFGAPLYQELFLELHKCQLEQNVFIQEVINIAGITQKLHTGLIHLWFFSSLQKSLFQKKGV